MADLFEEIVMKAMGLASIVQPLTASRFEPMPAEIPPYFNEGELHRVLRRVRPDRISRSTPENAALPAVSAAAAGLPADDVSRLSDDTAAEPSLPGELKHAGSNARVDVSRESRQNTHDEGANDAVDASALSESTPTKSGAAFERSSKSGRGANTKASLEIQVEREQTLRGNAPDGAPLVIPAAPPALPGELNHAGFDAGLNVLQKSRQNAHDEGANDTVDASAMSASTPTRNGAAFERSSKSGPGADSQGSVERQVEREEMSRGSAPDAAPVAEPRTEDSMESPTDDRPVPPASHSDEDRKASQSNRDQPISVPADHVESSRAAAEATPATDDTVRETDGVAAIDKPHANTPGGDASISRAAVIDEAIPSLPTRAVGQNTPPVAADRVAPEPSSATTKSNGATRIRTVDQAKQNTESVDEDALSADPYVGSIDAAATASNASRQLPDEPVPSSPDVARVLPSDEARLTLGTVSPELDTAWDPRRVRAEAPPTTGPADSREHLLPPPQSVRTAHLELAADEVRLNRRDPVPEEASQFGANSSPFLARATRPEIPTPDGESRDTTVGHIPPVTTTSGEQSVSRNPGNKEADRSPRPGHVAAPANRAVARVDETTEAIPLLSTAARTENPATASRTRSEATAPTAEDALPARAAHRLAPSRRAPSHDGEGVASAVSGQSPRVAALPPAGAVDATPLGNARATPGTVTPALDPALVALIPPSTRKLADGSGDGEAGGTLSVTATGGELSVESAPENPYVSALDGSVTPVAEFLPMSVLADRVSAAKMPAETPSVRTPDQVQSRAAGRDLSASIEARTGPVGPNVRELRINAISPAEVSPAQGLVAPAPSGSGAVMPLHPVNIIASGETSAIPGADQPNSATAGHLTSGVPADREGFAGAAHGANSPDPPLHLGSNDAPLAATNAATIELSVLASASDGASPMVQGNQSVAREFADIARGTPAEPISDRKGRDSSTSSRQNIEHGDPEGISPPIEATSAAGNANTPSLRAPPPSDRPAAANARPWADTADGRPRSFSTDQEPAGSVETTRHGIKRESAAVHSARPLEPGPQPIAKTDLSHTNPLRVETPNRNPSDGTGHGKDPASDSGAVDPDATAGGATCPQRLASTEDAPIGSLADTTSVRKTASRGQDRLSLESQASRSPIAASAAIKRSGPEESTIEGERDAAGKPAPEVFHIFGDGGFDGKNPSAAKTQTTIDAAFDARSATNVVAHHDATETAFPTVSTRHAKPDSGKHHKPHTEASASAIVASTHESTRGDHRDLLAESARQDWRSPVAENMPSARLRSRAHEGPPLAKGAIDTDSHASAADRADAASFSQMAALTGAALNSPEGMTPGRTGGESDALGPTRLKRADPIDAADDPTSNTPPGPRSRPGEGPRFQGARDPAISKPPAAASNRTEPGTSPLSHEEEASPSWRRGGFDSHPADVISDSVRAAPTSTASNAEISAQTTASGSRFSKKAWIENNTAGIVATPSSGADRINPTAAISREAFSAGREVERNSAIPGTSTEVRDRRGAPPAMDAWYGLPKDATIPSDAAPVGPAAPVIQRKAINSNRSADSHPAGVISDSVRTAPKSTASNTEFSAHATSSASPLSKQSRIENDTAEIVAESSSAAARINPAAAIFPNAFSAGREVAWNSPSPDTSTGVGDRLGTRPAMDARYGVPPDAALPSNSAPVVRPVRPSAPVIQRKAIDSDPSAGERASLPSSPLVRRASASYAIANGSLSVAAQGLTLAERATPPDEDRGIEIDLRTSVAHALSHAPQDDARAMPDRFDGHLNSLEAGDSGTAAPPALPARDGSLNSTSGPNAEDALLLARNFLRPRAIRYGDTPKSSETPDSENARRADPAPALIAALAGRAARQDAQRETGAAFSPDRILSAPTRNEGREWTHRKQTIPSSIELRIGRIEIREPEKPRNSRTARRSPRPSISLDSYLREREGHRK